MNKDKVNAGVNQGIVIYQYQKAGNKGANADYSKSISLFGGSDIAEAEIGGNTIVDKKKKERLDMSRV